MVTSAGNIYEVSLLFEVLQLYVIDARGYASVEALLADIEKHKQRHELAARVYVIHIGYKADIVGTLVYNSVSNQWTLLNDPLERVDREGLFIPVNMS